jgi:hypothetical protein
MLARGAAGPVQALACSPMPGSLFLFARGLRCLWRFWRIPSFSARIGIANLSPHIVFTTVFSSIALGTDTWMIRRRVAIVRWMLRHVPDYYPRHRLCDWPPNVWGREVRRDSNLRRLRRSWFSWQRNDRREKRRDWDLVIPARSGSGRR